MQAREPGSAAALRTVTPASIVKAQVSRLQGIIEAQTLAGNVAEDVFRSILAHERRRADRLERERDAALNSRFGNSLSMRLHSLASH